MSRLDKVSAALGTFTVLISRWFFFNLLIAWN